MLASRMVSTRIVLVMIVAVAACARPTAPPAPAIAPAASVRVDPPLPSPAPTAPAPDTCEGDEFGLGAGGLDRRNASVMGKRGTGGRAQHTMVATSHKLATEAGLAVLRKGGNAADAFLAATLVQDVVLPGVTSTAGLAGILVYEAKSGALTYIHGGLADPVDPAARYRFGDKEIGKQVLIPGAPAAYATLAKRFGTRRLRELVEPAAHTADGFRPDRLYLFTIESRKEILERSAYGRTTFFREGRPIKQGDTLKLPEVAKTLRAFGDDPNLFYRGAWPGGAIVLAREYGGALAVRDFESYAPEVSTPIHGHFMGHDVYAAGHGGMKLLIALGALERLRDGAPSYPPSGSAGALERLVRVMRTVDALPVLRDRTFIAPTMWGLATEPLLAGFLKKRVEEVWRDVAKASEPPAPPGTAGTHSSSVVVVDAQGNVVVGTHTIEALPWGEGLFVGGIPLATAAPAGMDDATKASVRMRTDALTDTIVLKDGHLRAALAVYGTGLFPADVQILDAVLARGTRPEDAVLEPRVGYSQWNDVTRAVDPKINSVDPRFPPDLLCEMKHRGLMLERSMPNYPPGYVDTGFPTLVTVEPTGLEGMTPDLMSGVADGD